ESEVQITDDDRTKWIAENKTRIKDTYDKDYERLYNHPEQARLRLIRLAVLPDGPPLAELVPRLNKVREQIVAGADMASLAERWSEDPSAIDGGDLGLRPISQLSSDMSRAIDGVNAGSFTRVFTTATDARLVRVEERVAPKVDSLESVTNDIADRLMKEE